LVKYLLCILSNLELTTMQRNYPPHAFLRKRKTTCDKRIIHGGSSRRTATVEEKEKNQKLISSDRHLIDHPDLPVWASIPGLQAFKMIRQALCFFWKTLSAPFIFLLIPTIVFHPWIGPPSHAHPRAARQSHPASQDPRRTAKDSPARGSRAANRRVRRPP